MSSCGSAQKASPPSAPLPAVWVNGTKIDEADLANELQYHQNKDFDVVVQQSAQVLVIRQLLLDEASKKDLDISKDNQEEALQKLMAENVIYDDPTNETCLRYFENNPGKFKTVPLMEVDHILLAAAKDDLPTRELAKNQAMEIIQQLKNNPMLFPALAKQYSACPSKATDGSLGQISKGQTVPEFERQLMLMPQGLAEKPIESRYGFHVTRITRKIEGKPLEYSMVEDKIKGYLVHRASHLAIQAYIQKLLDEAVVEGVELRFDEENIHI